MASELSRVDAKVLTLGPSATWGLWKSSRRPNERIASVYRRQRRCHRAGYPAALNAILESPWSE